METQICCATPADLTALRLHLEAAGLVLEGIEDHLASCWLAIQAEHLLGSALLEVYGGAALLRAVAVRPEWRGTGLGGRLVHHALEQAHRLKVREVWLLTETAELYFPRFGFAVAPRNAVPETLKASVEFRGACPSSATAMRFALESMR